MYSHPNINYQGSLNNAYERMPDDYQLINDIQKAINAEYSAISCYAYLAKISPAKDVQEKILEIQQDEKRHLKEFSNIYRNLTGQQPTYKITEECPKTYKEGIKY